MSICCILIIVIIIIVGIVVIYFIQKLYNKINEKLNYDNVTDTDNTTIYNTLTANDYDISSQTLGRDNDDQIKYIKESSQKTISSENSTIFSPLNKQTSKMSNSVVEYLIFSMVHNVPTVRACNNKYCGYMHICDVQVCNHLTTSKLLNDKNTTLNVTYIHVGNHIVTLIGKNENVCTREQEILSLEDINYINAYTSKYQECAVHTIFYNTDCQGCSNNINTHECNGYFIDFNDKLHHGEYVINLTASNNIFKREIFQTSNLHKYLTRHTHIPSAPPPQQQQLQHAENHGNLIYLTKN